MVNSRAKGARGERMWRDFLRKNGHEARRGQQFAGNNGDPDVVSDIKDVHFEVKNVEHLNLYKAMDQSVSDARDGEVPVVVHKKNGKPWLVTMRAEDWLKMHDKGDADGNQSGEVHATL